MFGNLATAADSWKSASGNALFSFMTDGFWNFQKRRANKWGSTLTKRKQQENTLVTMIHWHSFPHKLAFNGNLIKFTRSSNNLKQQAEFPSILDNVAICMILLWPKRSFRWQLLVLIGWGGVGWIAGGVVPPPTGAHPTCYLPTIHPSVRSACWRRMQPCNIQLGWDFQPRGTLGPGNSKAQDDWIVPPPQTMPCSLLNQRESILTEMSGLLLLNGALWWS